MGVGYVIRISHYMCDSYNFKWASAGRWGATADWPGYVVGLDVPVHYVAVFTQQSLLVGWILKEIDYFS